MGKVVLTDELLEHLGDEYQKLIKELLAKGIPTNDAFNIYVDDFIRGLRL